VTSESPRARDRQPEQMHLTALGDVHGAASGLIVDDHYAAVRFCDEEVNRACYLLFANGRVVTRGRAGQQAGRV
jgi:hypothetical protein